MHYFVYFADQTAQYMQINYATLWPEVDKTLLLKRVYHTIKDERELLQILLLLQIYAENFFAVWVF